MLSPSPVPRALEVKKRLADALQVRLGDTAALVNDHDSHLPIPYLGAQAHGALVVASLERIQTKVDQDLPDLVRVDVKLQAWFCFAQQLRVVRLCQPDDLLEQRRDSNHLGLSRVRPPIFQQIAGDMG